MQYANCDAERSLAAPGAIGNCPVCSGKVIARCGEINTWHWAHVSGEDCDSWAEPESEWHLRWKKKFFRQWREYRVGNHRADVQSPRAVIELQRSSIAVEEIQDREEFYGEMVWVLEASRFNIVFRDQGNYVTFRWKHPRKSWWYATRPLYFDIGNRLLEVRKLYTDLPCRGWGRFVDYETFVETYSRPRRGTELCERCRMPISSAHLISTGMYEYCTMDLDPETRLCYDCIETIRLSHIPDHPDLWDAYTPIEARY